MNRRLWTEHLRTLAQRKEVKELMAEVEKLGTWQGRLGGQGHIVLRHTSGLRVTVSSTPSNPRSLSNTRAEIRRVEGAAK